MSKRNLAKGSDDFHMELIVKFRRLRGEACRIEDVAKWILDEGLLPPPQITPLKLLTTKLKQAARRKRIKDKQGRKVRAMIAAKSDRVDENGNRYIDVVWDFLHECSADHGLTSFMQRDDVIDKQRKAATRDVLSFLDNNPNAAGHEHQCEFGFMLEEPVKQVCEVIQETPPALPGDEDLPGGDSKPKPR